MILKIKRISLIFLLITSMCVLFFGCFNATNEKNNSSDLLSYALTHKNETKYVKINGESYAYNMDGEFCTIEGDIIIGKVGDSDEKLINEINKYYNIENKNILAEKNTDPRSKTIIPGDSNRWSYGIIYYSYDANYPETERAHVAEAMQWWMIKVPGITFTNRSNQANYINFKQNSEKNSSYVGKIGGMQVINIYDVNETGKIAHEIGHALGLHHIQCRSDRDLYVTVYKDNVEDVKTYNVNFNPLDASWKYGNEYDYDSIMHYPWWAFGKSCQPGDNYCYRWHWYLINGYYKLGLEACTVGNGCSSGTLITIEAKNDDSIKSKTAKLGQRDHLSVIDIEKVNYMYTDSSEWDMVVGDFNGDGRSDCIHRNKKGILDSYLYTSNGNGTFNLINLTNGDVDARAIWGGPQWAMFTGDFNGDSRTDVLLRHIQGTDDSFLFTSNGNGTFADTNLTNGDPLWRNIWGGPQWAMFTEDFNGDGRIDVLLRHNQGTNDSFLITSNGNGTFSGINLTNGDPLWRNIWGGSQWVMFTGDFNGDGKYDALLRHNQGTNDSFLMTSSGNGTFNLTSLTNGDPLWRNIWGGPQWAMFTGDFNGDGKTDVLLRHNQGTNDSFLITSNGNGTFSGINLTNGDSIWRNIWGGPQWAMFTGDFNGDGRTDVLLRHNQGTNDSFLITSNGNGTFSGINLTNGDSIWRNIWGGSHWAMFTGDFNGDSRTDVLLRHIQGTNDSFLFTSYGNGFNYPPINLSDYYTM